MKWLILGVALAGCASTLPSRGVRGQVQRQAQLCLDDGAPRPG